MHSSGTYALSNLSARVVEVPAARVEGEPNDPHRLSGSYPISSSSSSLSLFCPPRLARTIKMMTVAATISTLSIPFTNLFHTNAHFPSLFTSHPPPPPPSLPPTPLIVCAPVPPPAHFHCTPSSHLSSLGATFMHKGNLSPGYHCAGHDSRQEL